MASMAPNKYSLLLDEGRPRGDNQTHPAEKGFADEALASALAVATALAVAAAFASAAAAFAALA